MGMGPDDDLVIWAAWVQVSMGMVAVWDELSSEGGKVLEWEVYNRKDETWGNEGTNPHLRPVLQTKTDVGSGGVRRAVNVNICRCTI